MPRICSSLALVLLSGTVACAAADDPKILEQHFGPVTARLSVAVAAPSDGPIPLTMTIELEGPVTLEVEGVRLADPMGGWDPTLLPAKKNDGKGQRTWVQVIRLMIKKPGPNPPPTVSVRFRPSAGDAWERVEWTDPLGRGTPGPALEPPPPPAGRPWYPLAAAAGIVLIVGIGALVVLRWRRPAPPLGPRERALRDLMALVDDERDPQTFHDRLALALRAFLAARFGLPAGQQTTAELVKALGGVGELSPEQRERVHELLARCDAVRFGGRGSTPEEVHWAREEARQFLEKVR